MPRKTSDPIKTSTRRAKAQRRVGDGAACACGETRPEALVVGAGPTTCAACKRRRLKKTTTDSHHVAGQNNSPVTVEVPVNDHRAVLSPAQYEWPSETLQNADGSPLLSAAGALRGMADYIIYLAEKFFDLIAVMLEELDRWLVGERGPQWWVNTPIECCTL